MGDRNVHRGSIFHLVPFELGGMNLERLQPGLSNSSYACMELRGHHSVLTSSKKLSRLKYQYIISAV